jgi:ribosome maturation factor RimP
MADLEAVRAAVEHVLPPLGLELVDVELVGSGRARTLRLFVDRPPGAGVSPEMPGVDLEALAAASEPLSTALDAADVLAGPYTLEVSSPGVERPLRRPGDFARFVGQVISLKSREAVSGARRHRGVLVEASDDEVVIEVDGEARRFPYPGITQARTVFEWGPTGKSGTGKPGHGKGRPKAQGGGAVPRSGGGKRDKILAQERSG